MEKKLNQLIEEIKKYQPKFEIRFKSESLLNKIISKILFFNKNYMTGSTTTLFKKVYFTDKEFFDRNPHLVFWILAHEFVHIYDSTERPILFELLYLFPQILSLFAFLTFINPWFLLCLIFLAPIPAPFRKWYETRGYAMSYYCKTRMVKNFDSALALKKIDEKFSGPYYYYMWPLGSVAEDIYFHKRDEIPFLIVKKILDE
ncbi:MAG: hypothetical protein BV456_00705 [Thermoplasmata archaeon M8B2D]|nr:MAG: hypothetical protein BV456_00705 [Thermoplasmata archaeon M8B2D]